MGSTDIAFPNLGIYLSDVPKTFSIFGISIALYGVIIALGMLSGVLLATRIAKKSGQSEDLYWDFFIWGSIFSIVGARIYYVIFEWEFYRDHPLSIFNLREGGLAIYGAVIGAFITIGVYSKLKKQNPFLMGDTMVAGLALGQAVGRWGNFFNREVFGEYTDSWLAMRLPVAAVRSRDISESIRAHIGADNFIQVHPTFLYESLWNLGVMTLILVWYKHRKFDGECILLYLAGYGIGRAWIEGIRTDQLYVPGTHVPVSQLLAIVTAVSAVIADIIIRIKLRNKGKAQGESLEEAGVEIEASK